MKQTLLDIVRLILNEMDSDDVNSISDTVEAMQTAYVVKGCFMEMTSNRNWPHLRKLVQIQHSGTIEKPTHLKLPENTTELVFFKYDKSKIGDGDIQYKEVEYKHPDDFLRLVSTVTPSTTDYDEVVDFSGVKLIIKNNKAPTYWTSFDDTYIVCDSYDRNVDDALQKSKTQCLAYMSPVWVHTDDAIPDLPTEAFSALIEEAKSTAFLTIKQMANEKAEQKAVRQQRWLSRKGWKAHGGVRYPNYGRTGKK